MRTPQTSLLIFLAAWFVFIERGAQGQALFRDDFNGSISDSWEIRNKDANYYSVTSTNLDLGACRGDLYSRANDYKNLFLVDNPASSDFVVTARLDMFEPDSKGYPQFDLVVYDSDDNHVRSNYGFLKSHRSMEFGAEVDKAWSSAFKAHDFENRHFYLQLRKAGNTYTPYYSTNGIDFIQSHPALTYGDGKPAQLGFVVMVDPTESSHAFVDYFEVTETNYIDEAEIGLPSWLENVAPTGDNASPDAAIELILRNLAKVEAKSFQLFVDGGAVKTDISTNSLGKTTIQYQADSLWEPGSSHSVRFTFVDHEEPAATNSYSYGFSINPNIIISK